MNEFTYPVATPLLTIKPSHTIILHNGSKQVGLLDFNGPVMTFEGDADESAKVFFDFVAARFAQRQPLTEERNFCPRCGKRLASGFVEISIHTCTPPKDTK